VRAILFHACYFAARLLQRVTRRPVSRVRAYLVAKLEPGLFLVCALCGLPGARAFRERLGLKSVERCRGHGNSMVGPGPHLDRPHVSGLFATEPLGCQAVAARVVGELTSPSG
jgi:hypothetical protein